MSPPFVRAPPLIVPHRLLFTAECVSIDADVKLRKKLATVDGNDYREIPAQGGLVAGISEKNLVVFWVRSLRRFQGERGSERERGADWFGSQGVALSHSSQFVALLLNGLTKRNAILGPQVRHRGQLLPRSRRHQRCRRRSALPSASFETVSLTLLLCRLDPGSGPKPTSAAPLLSDGHRSRTLPAALFGAEYIFDRAGSGIVAPPHPQRQRLQIVPLHPHIQERPFLFIFGPPKHPELGIWTLTSFDQAAIVANKVREWLDANEKEEMSLIDEEEEGDFATDDAEDLYAVEWIDQEKEEI